jgi:hypothetical protein
MNITTGLGSDAAFARAVERPSPCFPCSLCLTPTTACWLAARRSGDTLEEHCSWEEATPTLKDPDRVPDPSTLRRWSVGLDRSQPASSFRRQTFARWRIGWGAATRPIPRLAR